MPMQTLFGVQGFRHVKNVVLAVATRHTCLHHTVLPDNSRVCTGRKLCATSLCPVVLLFSTTVLCKQEMH